ncbi:synaptopodin-2-like isoform X1 [Anguilla anguilla]|uniref:synaptopodin-2-like isoform X1 n=1 Tax=Anguilla anguilla TaxID=7936 RepID=UPI0015A8CDB0|nr:synaptopodin-2-like isoform X1 [Anguilla anguilla]
MRSTSMGTGDYLCITVRGGAPWGFGLRQGDELHHPLLVCQVDTRGRGALAGLREGDEVVSLNGEPCADLTLPESIDLMESSDSLQLLVKRCGVPQLLAPDSEREGFGEAEPDGEGLESTTLEVWSAGGSRAREGGLEACESSQDEAYYGETESDGEPRAARSALETSCARSTLETSCARSALETSCARSALETSCARSALETSCARSTLETSCARSALETSCARSTLETSCARSTLETSCARSTLETSCARSTLETSCARSALETSCARSALETSCARSTLETSCARSTLETSCGGVTAGTVVELRVSLSERGGDGGGGGGGTVAVVSAQREGSPDLDSGGSKAELLAEEPPKQRGDLVTPSSCSVGQVEPTLQHPGKGWAGEEQEKEEEEEEEEEERGRVLSDPHTEEGGSSACVSFEISAEGAESQEERDSESERDLGRPSKHRARHARLRRSESQSEKQVKEAKSKCKRIALLLTDAPNPTNKGVLMFKRRRQRAKKYTLVSYGTGETEPEDEDEDEEEDYEEAEDDRAVELTLLATSESELSEDFSANAPGRGHAPGHDWDAALLEVERKVDAQGDMEQLPGTKGKGALMFARRRQRVDEIAAEHEEMRRKGIPVEGLPAEAQDVAVPKSPQVEEHSYTKASVPQPNQTFQHQQYQDQQQQQYVPTQQHPQVMNGTAHLHANDSSRSLVPNRTAKPFAGVQNRVPAPFSPSRSVASQPLPSYTEKFRVVPPPVPVNTRPQVWSPTGELIASRDERISVPAIKILPDSRKRGAAKSTLHTKVSPDPLFSMRGDRRAGFESGPEEDYLSLGAEACNFMQTPTVRSKDPPPVAPKPSINPASPPWATGNTTQSPSHQPQTQSPLLGPVPTAKPTQPQSPRQHASVTPWTPRQAQSQPPMNTWTPPQSQAHPQPPKNAWTPPQPQAHPQPPITSWTPQPQHAPVSTAATTQTHAPLHRPTKSWNQPGVPARSAVSRPMNSYPHATKTPPAVRDGSADEGLERSAMRGRGAELFARRQARMEKFVVDAETVQANKVKPSSPTPSLPGSWKFSSNVRAPPPLSYNPILSPFYPLAAIKQPPPTSPKAKAKSAAKTQPPPKHLNAVDVMKHQPYQLNPSLFTYEAGPEGKSASPKPAPTPDSSFTYSPSPVPTPSPVPAPTLARGVSKVQPPGPVSVPYPFARQRLSPESQHSLSPAVHDGLLYQAPASPHAQPPSAYTLPSFFLPPKAASITGVPSAPRPKFSAKKSLLATKTWKPVVMGQ